jgi:hypothetical protein
MIFLTYLTNIKKGAFLGACEGSTKEPLTKKFEKAKKESKFQALCPKKDVKFLLPRSRTIANKQGSPWGIADPL